MNGDDPTLPSQPVEANHVHAPEDATPPYGGGPYRPDHGGWTDTQRIVAGAIVAAIAVVVLVLVVFVFSGPDEATTPAPTVPATAAPITPSTTTSIAPSSTQGATATTRVPLVSLSLPTLVPSSP
jgi:hypothetical protein